MAWAPLHAREPSWGDPWVPYGLGLPADALAKRIEVKATVEGYRASLPDRSNRVYSVTGSDGEVVLVETDGLASAHDGALDSALAFTSRRFCVDGDCICPPGTQRAGEHLADEAMHLPFVVAFQAPAGGAHQRISSKTMEQECGRDERSPAPSASGKRPVATGRKPPRCGGQCASSIGDPHMRTVDGVGYDFQAAGEFTLLQTPDGEVDVQVRQEPADGPERGIVSNTTAVAARVGDHRVGVYLTPAGLELRVDGVIQAGAGPFDLGGGRAGRFSTGIVIDLPDGTVIWAISEAPYEINVLVDPASTAADVGRGLVGRSAPGLGVPRLPDGAALPKAVGRPDFYAMLYQRFADAWRVTDTTTLFDYDPGMDTASYTIRDYPSPPKVASLDELDPAKAAAARATCASVTDAALQDQCTFDVAVTGDAGYVRPYQAIEQVVEHGTVAPNVPVATASDAAGCRREPARRSPARDPPAGRRRARPRRHRLPVGRDGRPDRRRRRHRPPDRTDPSPGRHDRSRRGCLRRRIRVGRGALGPGDRWLPAVLRQPAGPGDARGAGDDPDSLSSRLGPDRPRGGR